MAKTKLRPATTLQVEANIAVNVEFPKLSRFFPSTWWERLIFRTHLVASLLVARPEADGLVHIFGLASTIQTLTGPTVGYLQTQRPLR